MQLVCLFGLISFGDQNETMTSGEFAERGGDVGEKLDLLRGDGLGEAFDAAVLVFGHG